MFRLEKEITEQFVGLEIEFDKLYEILILKVKNALKTSFYSGRRMAGGKQASIIKDGKLAILNIYYDGEIRIFLVKKPTKEELRLAETEKEFIFPHRKNYYFWHFGSGRKNSALFDDMIEVLGDFRS